MTDVPVRVFVSYAHDSDEHKAQVLQFAAILRDRGVDAQLDRYDSNNRRDWHAWMINKITTADYVLVVASSGYRLAGDGNGPADQSRGVQTEAALLRSLLHADRPLWTRKILPVVLPGHTVGEIPYFLQPYCASHYLVDELAPAGMDELLRTITQQPSHPAPELGPIAVLPPAKPFSPRNGRVGAAMTALGLVAAVLGGGIALLTQQTPVSLVASAGYKQDLAYPKAVVHRAVGEMEFPNDQDCPAVASWALAQGGTRGSGMAVRLTLSNKGTPVVVQRIGVRVTNRREASGGTAFVCSPQGVQKPFPLTVDLDEQTPVVRTVKEDGAVGGIFSEDSVVELNGETQTFDIAAVTKKYVCDWAIDIEYVADGRRGTLSVTAADGQDFQTAALDPAPIRYLSGRGTLFWTRSK